MIKKIAILGPESTGKTSLCEQLAGHYRTPWVPEYARIFLLQHGMKYTYHDLLTIAKGQLALEDKYLEEFEGKLKADHVRFQSPGFHPPSYFQPLFIDTNMHVLQVWCEFVFGQCHDWILHQIAHREYDFYLLCDTDLPWVKDELREYPDLESRRKLFHIYRDMMINQPVPWIEINGNHEERFVKAVIAVNDLLVAG